MSVVRQNILCRKEHTSERVAEPGWDTFIFIRNRLRYSSILLKFNYDY